jgi:hypothetical protein
VRSLAVVLLLAGAALPKGDEDAPALPPPRIELRVDVPDLAGPWKMVVTNQGDVPVRLAADGRLLALEIKPKPEAEAAESPAKKKHKPPARSTMCRLPAELRPSEATDDRAVVLGPGARYEEVVSPALYCFDDAGSKALVAGAEVVAHFGFPESAKPSKRPPKPPWVVEPATKVPTVSGLKELTSLPFVLPAASPVTAAPAPGGPESNDPNGPKIQLEVPLRVDTPNERTVAMTFTVRNGGGRAVPLHIRRDNLMIDLDGPDGSAHCGFPAARRGVAKDLFTTLGAGAAQTFDIWVGEICPDVVFDRPGLYRLRASLAFPSSGEAYSLKAWTQTVTAKEPILVRVREGRLPFYSSPPQILGGSH